MVAISSFSAFRELDPIMVPVEDPQGETVQKKLTDGGPLRITDFPELARDRLGADFIEICQTQISDTSDAYLGAIRHAVAAAGIEVLTVPIDAGNIAHPIRERRAAHLDTIRQWLDFAGDLDATFARVNLGSTTGSPADHLEAATESLAALVDHADRRGLGLLIENHGGSSADPGWMIDVVEAVGHERLGVVLDTGNWDPMLGAAHARFIGEPIDESVLDFEPVYASIARLAPYATIVHAKSHDISEDGSVGPIDLRRALEVIRTSGFDGPITVEYEGDSGDTWENTRRTAALVREVFDR